jgi:hypothetical protein
MPTGAAWPAAFSNAKTESIEKKEAGPVTTGPPAPFLPLPFRSFHPAALPRSVCVTLRPSPLIRERALFEFFTLALPQPEEHTETLAFQTTTGVFELFKHQVFREAFFSSDFCALCGM